MRLKAPLRFPMYSHAWLIDASSYLMLIFSIREVAYVRSVNVLVNLVNTYCHAKFPMYCIS